MAITVIDQEENRNRLIGQISQNLQTNRELSLRRDAALMEAKRAERQMMLERAKSALDVRKQRFEEKKFGAEQAKAGTDMQLDIATKLGMKPAKRADLLAMDPKGRREALRAAQTFGGQKFMADPRMNAVNQGVVFDPVKGEFRTPTGEQVNYIPKGAEVRNLRPSTEVLANESAARASGAQKFFSDAEVKEYQAIADSRDTITELRAGLDELGIKDPSKFGSIEPETVDSALGPISIPARFNLAGQYAKDPKYTAMKNKLERFFNNYRKVVTGAQASFQELQALRQAVGSFSDRPGVFFSNLDSIQGEMDRILENRFGVADAIGRDTTKLREFFKKKENSNIDQSIPQDLIKQVEASTGFKIKSAKFVEKKKESK